MKFKPLASWYRKSSRYLNYGTSKNLPGDRTQCSPQDLEVHVELCPAAPQTRTASATDWSPACDNVAVRGTNKTSKKGDTFLHSRVDIVGKYTVHCHSLLIWCYHEMT